MQRRLLVPLLLLAPLVANAAAHGGDWRILPDQSRVVATVHKKGVLSPALHDHFLVPSRWGGTLRFDPAHPETATADVVIDAGSLRDEQKELSTKDRTKVEGQVKELLEAEKYPRIELHAQRFEPGTRAGDAAMDGVLVAEVSLHGQKRTVRIPTHVAWSAGGLTATGKLSLKQTDFGIKPYQKMGGAISIGDKVDIALTIRAEPE
jgi:polyisoprenoid-binding protein YceI